MKYWALFLFCLCLEICHAQDFIELQNQAGNFFNEKRYDSAIFYLEKIKGSRVDNDSNFFISYAIGVSYLNLHAPRLAQKALLRSRKIALSIYGKNSEEYLMATAYLGNCYKNLSAYDTVENLKTEELELTVALHGTADRRYVISIVSFANLYVSLNKYTKADSLFQIALNGCRELDRHDPIQTFVLAFVGEFYEKRGEYKNSKKIYLQELAIQTEKFGKDHPDCANTYCSIALLSQRMGNYFDAEGYYSTALDIYRNTVGAKNKDYLSTVTSLATIEMFLGKYNKAEKLLVKNLYDQRNTLNEYHPDYLLTLSSLSILRELTRDYIQADSISRVILEKQEKLNGRESFDYLSTLRDLARVNKLAQKYSESLTIANECLEISEKVFGKNNVEYLNSMKDLADIYLSMNDTSKTNNLFSQALTLQEAINGKNNVEYINILNGNALFHQSIGSFSSAEKEFLESLQLNKALFGDESDNTQQVIGSLGSCYSLMRNYPKATSYKLKNIKAVNNSLQKNFLFMSENDKLEFTKYLFEEYSDFNFYLWQLSFRPDQLTNELRCYSYNNELQNKNLILNNYLKIHNYILNSGNDTLIQVYNDLVELRHNLSILYSKPINKKTTSANELETKKEQLEKKLSTSLEVYKNAKQRLIIDWMQVRKKLNAHEAAIEFINFSVLDTLYYAALVLRSDFSSPDFSIVLIETQLAQLLEKKGHADSVYFNSLYDNETNNGKLLNVLVWRPLDSILKGVKTIYVAPTGLLNKINLAAIPLNVETFGEKFDVHLLGSTGEIIDYKPTFLCPQTIQQAIVYGGIDYDRTNYILYNKTNNDDNVGYQQIADVASRSAIAKFGYLPGTKEEAKKIEQVCDRNNIATISFTDENATETSFKQLSGKKVPFILHIASHGYFFPDPEKEKSFLQKSLQPEGMNIFKWSDDPLLRSGLIFAGANNAWGNPNYISDSAEDGILTSYEISNLDLSNCQLVVLSACETGLGDIKGSEGVFGLQRAFKMAGVKNIIMSLWKVPDKETQELMTSFYNYCFSGKSVHDALQAAQSDMKKKYSPYFWAGFKLLE
jgi:CHAT domain-containing protein